MRRALNKPALRKHVFCKSRFGAFTSLPFCSSSSASLSSVPASFTDAVGDFQESTRLITRRSGELLDPSTMHTLAVFFSDTLRISQDPVDLTDPSSDDRTTLRIEFIPEANPSDGRSRVRILDSVSQYLDSLIKSKQTIFFHDPSNEIMFSLRPVLESLPMRVIDYLRFGTGAHITTIFDRQTSNAKLLENSQLHSKRLRGLHLWNGVDQSGFTKDILNVMVFKELFNMRLLSHLHSDLESVITGVADSDEQHSSDDNDDENDENDGSLLFDPESQLCLNLRPADHNALEAIVDAHAWHISHLEWRWFAFVFPVKYHPINEESTTNSIINHDLHQSFSLGVWLAGSSSSTTTDSDSNSRVPRGQELARLDAIHERLVRLFGKCVTKIVQCRNEESAEYALSQWRDYYFSEYRLQKNREQATKRAEWSEMNRERYRMEQERDPGCRLPSASENEGFVEFAEERIFVNRFRDMLVIECDAMSEYDNSPKLPFFGMNEVRSNNAAKKSNCHKQTSDNDDNDENEEGDTIAQRVESKKNRAALRLVNETAKFLLDCQGDYLCEAKTRVINEDDEDEDGSAVEREEEGGEGGSAKVVSERDDHSNLDDMPVTKIRGCGPVLTQRLENEYQVFSVGDLARIDESKFNNDPLCKRLIKVKDQALLFSQLETPEEKG